MFSQYAALIKMFKEDDCFTNLIYMSFLIILPNNPHTILLHFMFENKVLLSRVQF